MATAWHYRRLDQELGPVSFTELVRVVRAGELAADDQVREDWNPDWRPAALAVGLFHMAGRQDLFDRWEAEQTELRRQAAAAQSTAEISPVAADPAWQQRLRQIAAERVEAAAVERAAQQSAVTRTDIDATLAAALAEIDAREQLQTPCRWQCLCRWLALPENLHRMFRYGAALVAPNLLAWSILEWSEREAQRFPNPQSLGAGVRPFPLWGECDPTLYFFLLIDAMILGGVAGYCLARTLERYVSD